MTAVLHSTTVRRIIKADPETVFEAFSKAEALQKWFSPHPEITLEVLEFQFWEGGTYRFRYSMRDGSTPVLGGRFERIKPHQKLAFTWTWEAPDPHADIPTIVSIEFLAREGTTEIVLTHAQIPSEAIADRHAAGWEATFDHLETALFPKSQRTGSNEDA
ncbi:SRPBCC family protein [Roseibium sp.]|uniref:SRPBCC family protein n=1 Tax=Roseibium sp. TaxID=1936156 RepID=UPI003B524FDF